MQAMKRHQPIPLIQPSGIQPYHSAGGQMPGAALTAMQNGRTLFGYNPADVQRQSMAMAKRRPRPASLLESLLR